MQDLELVCKELLTQSTLLISLDAVTSSVRLEFTTADKQAKVTFLGHEYVQFHVAKPKDEDCDFRVVDAIVDMVTEQQLVETLFEKHGWDDVIQTDIEPLYNIRVRGEIAVDIICARFAWKQDDGEFSVPTLPHQVM